ncbi:MAG: folate family ECF transporter S component [Clostridiales Family XIII bacterium]|jgi:ECF transporter S component (folate family)|nr:folate family ECF transporter S component [Clostridiales Family XIII bacterium]
MNNSTALNQVSRITVVAFLIALEVVLTRMLSINTPLIRISLGFLPIALIAIMYGPIWSAIAYAIGDIIGAMLWPTGPFFPGFTLSAILTGLTFGLFLYRKPITWKQSLLPAILISVVINMLLNNVWLYMIMGNAVFGILPMRIVKEAVMIVVMTITIPLVWKVLGSHVTRILHLDVKTVA